MAYDFLNAFAATRYAMSLKMACGSRWAVLLSLRMKIPWRFMGLLMMSSVLVAGCSRYNDTDSDMNSLLEQLKNGKDTSNGIDSIIIRCTDKDQKQKLEAHAKDTLISYLSDPNPQVRLLSINTLYYIDSSTAVKYIFDLFISDQDANVRDRSRSMLHEMVIYRAGPALGFIKEKLSSASTEERTQAQEIYNYFEQHSISLSSATSVQVSSNVSPRKNSANPSDLRQAKDMLRSLPSACNRSYISVSSDGTVNIRVLCSNANNQTDTVISIKDGYVSGLDGGTLIGR